MKNLLIALLLSFAVSSCTYMTTDNINCATVTGKERINGGEGGYYLVFTNKGEFKITDDLFRGNFESSAWYGQIKVDTKYSFKTGGYRLPFWSTYPNIITKPTACQ